ncbi:MAG: hypothetical protein ABIA75_03440 [Candidatus Neomarinimicrobiota bacterium]
MNRFSEVLIRINRQLDLPQTAKSRVLLEIAADLNDLYQLYHERGDDETTAHRKALEKAGVGDDCLRDLERIHRTGFSRWLGRFSRFRISFWERYLLFALAAFMLLLIPPELDRFQLVRVAGEYFWIQAGILLAVLFLIIYKTWELYLKQDHIIIRLRIGLILLPFLAGISLLLTVGGAIGELMVALEKSIIGLDTSPRSWLFLYHWLFKHSYAGSFSLLVPLVALLGWFGLFSKIATIERAGAIHLLAE